jgi:hypothetical protein
MKKLTSEQIAKLGGGKIVKRAEPKPPAPAPAPVVIEKPADNTALLDAKEANVKADAALKIANAYHDLASKLTEAVSKLERKQVKNIRITPKRGQNGLVEYYDLEVRS